MSGPPSATRLAPVLVLLLLAAPATLTAQDLRSPLTRGDALWEARAEGAADGWARAEPVERAIQAYEEAWKASPGDPEVAWRLARALWFQAEYATRDAKEKQVLLARATARVEEALDRLAAPRGGRDALDGLDPAARARRLRNVPAAAPLYHWAAVSWGVWGEVSGKVAAARRGVGGKIRDYAETVIAIDPEYDHAGGHRVLGRLHAEAPHIPFFTGWVDRDRAIQELETATRLAPDHLFNPLYLAEAILAHRPREEPRARRLLEEVANATPSPEYLVEETRLRLRAAELLKESGR